MECAGMDEPNNKRIIGDEEDPEFFVYTSETKSTDIPNENLTHLRVDSSVSEIHERAFDSSHTLVHLQLPETLLQIKAFAFGGYSSLKCVQFVSDAYPVDASSINNNATYLEDGLILFPARREKLQVGKFAFSYCYSLRRIIVRSVSTELGYSAFSHCSGLISVELPEGLQEIGDRLFDSCGSLATVKVPSSVIKIGHHAFSKCRSLTSFDFPSGLLEIGRGSFFGCDSIVTVQVPATVSSIGETAFCYCSGLRNVSLPPTLETIEVSVFEGCPALECIILPNTTLKKVYCRAFYECSSLTHIRIPPSVESIGLDSFIRCGSLVSIELPEKSFLDSTIDLLGCHSLVNIAGSMLNVQVSFMRYFKENSKLGSLVDGHDDLVERLKHRFNDSPLHKLCYYQSYYASGDLMVQLRRLMDEDPLAAVTQVDEFGMTPLHVLSLSQSPNLDMLLALMNAGHRDHIIHSRDSFGSTPMDYLCLNRIPNSTRIIQTVLQTRFEHSLGWGQSNTMWQAVDEALAADWSSRRREIVAVYFKFAIHERKEFLSLVELCLWKAKFDDQVVSSELEDNADRQSCRIYCGASIVIPHVLSFLDTLDMEDYFARSP
eukprot:scaffold23472_cov106-Cylindrotheca_fusiformis.AAC.3